MFIRNRLIHVLGLVLLGIIAVAVLILGQTPNGPVMRYTATSANVAGAPDPIRIDVLAWSTDADRDHCARKDEVTRRLEVHVVLPLFPKVNGCEGP